MALHHLYADNVITICVEGTTPTLSNMCIAGKPEQSSTRFYITVTSGSESSQINQNRLIGIEFSSTTQYWKIVVIVEYSMEIFPT